MPVECRALAEVGAEVHGLAPGGLAADLFPAISAMLASYGLLVFRDQLLTRDAHIALARAFGRLDEFDTRVPNASPTPYVARTPGTAVITEISSVGTDGTVLAEEEARARRVGRQEAWRSDGSFKETSVKASILAAVEITPGAGGDTEFADMQAAFAALSEADQRHLQTLTAWHSAVYVRAAAGEIPLPPASDPTTMTGAAHGLVVDLPYSGGQALYIGENACCVLGMSVAESEQFLAGLRSAACRSPHVYRHQWRDGDVVIWDSRRFLHRTGSWDPASRRTLRHISIAGDG
jgi:alpha-ketoglutarate-dependent 2,4-dichlorophenoxyacetate dioxygenase